jgi:hypothetical protein
MMPISFPAVLSARRDRGGRHREVIFGRGQGPVVIIPSQVNRHLGDKKIAG